MIDSSYTLPIIPLSTFKDAFIKLFKCKHEELEADVEIENSSITVIYNSNKYRMATFDLLLDDVKGMLTDVYDAQKISIDIWREATHGVLSDQAFYDNLIESLETEQEAQTLYLSLSLSSLTPEKEKSFWNSLCRLDKQGTLFGSAIVAAAKTYNLDPLALEILEAMITFGDVEFCQIESGIFETIPVSVTGDILCLYIYTIID